MLKKYQIGVVLVLSCLAHAATVQNFQGGAAQTPYTLNQYENAPGPAIVSNSLLMVNANSQRNVIAFDQSDPGIYGRCVAEWDFSIEPGADGFNFALLNTEQFGATGQRGLAGIDEEEPSLADSFAVGFDIYCPDDDNYQKLGSHEISLHWKGVERANKWSSFDYRTASFNTARVVVDFVPGGAEITVSIAGHVIYDKYFLADMTTYDCRVAFGARTGGYKTNLYLDNVNVVFEEAAEVSETSITATPYDQKLMNGANRDVERFFNFPSDEIVYERVVLKLKVEEPSGGWDPWDRMMGIFIWDQGQQNRYELARFMTPYSKAGIWYIDVTDYQTLLRGNRKIGMWLDSWVGNNEDQQGYLITTVFKYYIGDPKQRIIGIQNLWNGTPTYGAGGDPQMTGFFADKQINVPTGTTKAKLRFMVTGHGQSPNTSSGAEFIARGRTVSVNDATYYNMLWRNDCYLNPCRPQSGTWKYSRAGWAPGDRVWPWEVDISNDVIPGQTAAIDYQADEYINSTPDWGNVSRQWVESQVVFYEPWNRDPVAYWSFNETSGSIAADDSGNNHHGQLTNMDETNWGVGKQCGGLSFDGVDDYIEIPGYKGITGGASRTCIAWVKTTKASVHILTWGATDAGAKWVIRTNENGTLRAEVSGGYIFGTTHIADGRWHHIAVVLQNDGSPDIDEVVLYVDGQTEALGGVGSHSVNTASADNVKIGVYSAGLKYFEGLIDEVQIYSRALDAAEIQSMYQAQILVGDTEPDGDIDLADFAVLASFWQNTGTCDGDLTCDCTVDIDDLMVLVGEWLHTN